MILSLTYYYETIPQAIQNIFTILRGSSMAKYMYIERAQFLMLRFHHCSRYSYTGEDDYNTMILVDSLINTASSLGLNHDIKVLYEGQEEIVGDLGTLSKSWDWVLFVDV